MIMICYLPETIEGVAYPKAAGAMFGYRVCINGEWYDCDKYGNVTDYRFRKEGQT